MDNRSSREARQTSRKIRGEIKMAEYYSAPVCMKCRKFMKCVERGVIVAVGVHSGHFHADKYQCPTCKHEIITKWASTECFSKCGKAEVTIQ